MSVNVVNNNYEYSGSNNFVIYGDHFYSRQMLVSLVLIKENTQFMNTNMHVNSQNLTFSNTPRSLVLIAANL